MATYGEALFTEIFDGIAAQWARLGARIVDYLQPGLTDAEITRMEELHGGRITVPAELRLLWQWHDGARTDGPAFSNVIGPGGFRFLSCASSFRTPALNSSNPSDDINVSRSERLIIMDSDQAQLYVNATNSRKTAGSTDWMSRVFVEDRDDLETVVGGPVGATFLEVFALWHWLLSEDYYRANSEGVLEPSGFEDWPFWMRLSALA